MKKQKALDIINRIIDKTDIAFGEDYCDVAALLDCFRKECLPTLPDYEDVLFLLGDKKKLYMKSTSTFLYRDGHFSGWYVIVKNDCVSIRYHKESNDDNYREVFLEEVEEDDTGLMGFITELQNGKAIGGKNFGISKADNLIFPIDEMDLIKIYHKS